MDDNSILGSALGQLGQTVKQGAKQVVKIPGEIGKDAGEQLGYVPQRLVSEEQVKQTVPSESKGWQSDEERIKFLRGLYGHTEQTSAANNPGLKADQNANPDPSASSGQGKKPSEFQEQIKDKSPEEQKKLTELRNQLHREVYYDPTFNPVKKQEERPAEKVENEKKQEMADLQQKDAKKPPPIAVQREQNKAEMFRGASG